MINTISKDKDGKFKSRSYIMKSEGAFRLVMKYALEHGYTDKHIGKLNLNKNLVEPDKDSRFIDTEKLRKLLECVADNPFYNTLVNLMLASGMRQEEALALNIDDVKKSVRDGVEMYQIYVSKAVVELSRNHYGVVNRLKHGEKARRIDITRDIYDMLMDYYDEDIKDEALMRKRMEHGTERMIFVNQNGQAHNKRTLHHSLRNYLAGTKDDKRMGGEDKVTLHMLRHTFASLMKNEIPLDRVSEILGHSDISITRRFYDTQTLEDHKRAGEAVEVMMRKIKG